MGKRDIYFKDTSLLKTQEFITNITKLCWESRVEYKILYYNEEKVMLSLKGFLHKKLIIYHNACEVKERDINLFIYTKDYENIGEGVYITSGTFERDFRKLGEKIKFIDREIFKKFNFKVLKNEFDKKYFDYYKIVLR